MLELIYSIQAYLASQDTSIDTILALVIALFVFMGISYFVEDELSNKENSQ